MTWGHRMRALPPFRATLVPSVSIHGTSFHLQIGTHFLEGGKEKKRKREEGRPGGRRKKGRKGVGRARGMEGGREYGEP